MASILNNQIRSILGVGVAFSCILWVLYHLVLFYSTGYVMVGEGNKGILIVEISFVALGSICFLSDYIARLGRSV